MKVICITRCFYSKGLKRFDEDEEYDLDQDQLKEILDADMGKYFSDELGEPLTSYTEKPPKDTAKAPAKQEGK